MTEYGTCEASGGGRLDFNEADRWINIFNGNN